MNTHGVCSRPWYQTVNQTIQQKIGQFRCSKFHLHQMMACMMGDGNVIINGHRLLLNSVEREDGSGNSFNLNVSYGPERFNLYCRTTD